MSVRVAIVGAAGYIGGELLRLLLCHPGVVLETVTSNSQAGKRVDGPHPNLRGLTDLTFTRPENVGEHDVVFLAMPHTRTMHEMARFAALSPLVIDLSGDFRLRDNAVFGQYYGAEHACPELVGSFTPGLPELHRAALREGALVSVPGCMATAGILALRPLVAEGLITGVVQIDARTGSSGSGVSAGSENVHAERSGAMRVFAPVRHRHEAEISQSLGLDVRMSATGVEAVRGVQVLCRTTLESGVDERAVRRAFRAHYNDEPFVRVVTQKRGLHRLPDPKILSGSNFCDVGYALDEARGAIMAIGALDNLMKGGAGNAVQCMNIRLGLGERTGLEFPGLHPV